MPTTLQPGSFVREAKHPKRWGKLVGPGRQRNECLIQYSTGARMSTPAADLVSFVPTDAERTVIEKATRFFERARQRDGLG